MGGTAGKNIDETLIYVNSMTRASLGFNRKFISQNQSTLEAVINPVAQLSENGDGGPLPV